MWKIVTMLLYFLRELVFESPGEYDFKSNKFNPRKIAILLLLSASIIFNVLLIERIVYISDKYILLREQKTEKNPPECVKK